MRVFLTGGAGYIGSACAEYLLDRGYEVTVFDDLITGHIEAVDPRARFIKANLSDRENLIKVVKEGKYDAVMHFAAFSLVGESMKNPSKYFNNNLANAINLADAAVEGEVKTFVFSSTAATFGEPEEVPIKEDAPQHPINPYGESKLCFEKVLNWYSRIYGLKYAALRYFNAAGATGKYGEDHNPETHLIPILLQVLFFLTPIFYSQDMLPEPYRSIMAYNPLAVLVQHGRMIFLYGKLPPFHEVFWMYLCSFAVFELGYLWFMKTKRGFADVI